MPEGQAEQSTALAREGRNTLQAAAAALAFSPGGRGPPQKSTPQSSRLAFFVGTGPATTVKRPADNYDIVLADCNGM